MGVSLSPAVYERYGRHTAPSTARAVSCTVGGMASLIQQRMAIDRQRNFGTTYLVLGITFIVVGIAELSNADTTMWPGAMSLVLGIFWLSSGVVQRVKSERARRAFEAEHGANAGRQ